MVARVVGVNLDKPRLKFLLVLEGQLLFLVSIRMMKYGLQRAARKAHRPSVPKMGSGDLWGGGVRSTLGGHPKLAYKIYTLQIDECEKKCIHFC